MLTRSLPVIWTGLAGVAGEVVARPMLPTDGREQVLVAADGVEVFLRGDGVP
jgi:hypothetical protein